MKIRRAAMRNAITIISQRSYLQFLRTSKLNSRSGSTPNLTLAGLPAQRKNGQTQKVTSLVPKLASTQNPKFNSN